MKSLQSNLNPVVTALLKVTDNVGEFEAIDATKSHVIYQPDTEAKSVYSDNQKEIQTIQGSIDAYLISSDMEIASQIQNALNDAGIVFYLNSVQIDEGSTKKFIHYEWICEVS